MSKRRSQLLLAGLILAGLALLSIQTPALTPWFVGWLLVAVVIGYAYKRREPRLVLVSLVALLVMSGLGLYPKWQRALQQVAVTSGYGDARTLAGRLTPYVQAHGHVPPPGDPAWQELTAGLSNPYRHSPEFAALQVVPLPHRAGLVTAAQMLPPLPARAGDLTVFVAEDRFFAVGARDDHGAALPFSAEFSNLQGANSGTGDVRAVDQGAPGNRPGNASGSPVSGG